MARSKKVLTKKEYPELYELNSYYFDRTNTELSVAIEDIVEHFWSAITDITKILKYIEYLEEVSVISNVSEDDSEVCYIIDICDSILSENINMQHFIKENLLSEDYSRWKKIKQQKLSIH